MNSVRASVIVSVVCIVIIIILVALGLLEAKKSSELLEESSRHIHSFVEKLRLQVDSLMHLLYAFILFILTAVAITSAIHIYVKDCCV